jgi:geranylgeranyl diphosphate synthase type I
MNQIKHSEMREMLDQMNQLIRETCISALDSNNDLTRAVEYHLSITGSQSRAQLCLSASLALGIETHDALRLAASVECLHNASLIQDDLQDGDTHRRGQIAIWHKYGANTAINTTDLMIASAFALVVPVDGASHAVRLVSSMQKAIAITLQGQTRDLSSPRRPDLKYSLSVAEEKSGPLFALSLELPLIVSYHEEFLEDARQAGACLGAGYQVIDDLQDSSRDQKSEDSANLILVMEQALNPRDAQIQAEACASHYLQRAVELANKLPSSCAELLVSQCKNLLSNLAREAA